MKDMKILPQKPSYEELLTSYESLRKSHEELMKENAELQELKRLAEEKCKCQVENVGL